MIDIESMRAAEEQLRNDMKAWFAEAALVTTEDDAFRVAEEHGAALQRRLETEHGFQTKDAIALLYPGLSRLYEIRYGTPLHECEL